MVENCPPPLRFNWNANNPRSANNRRWMGEDLWYVCRNNIRNKSKIKKLNYHHLSSVILLFHVKDMIDWDGGNELNDRVGMGAPVETMGSGWVWVDIRGVRSR